MLNWDPECLRKQYRNSRGVSRMVAMVKCGSDTSHRTRVMNTSSGGAALFIDGDNHDKFWTLGDHAEVCFMSEDISGIVRAETEFVHRMTLGSDCSVYGVRFTERDKLFTQIKGGWFRIFNRRQALRVPISTSQKIPAAVLGRGISLRGHLANLSVHGIGILVEPIESASLAPGAHLRVSLVLPDSDSPMRFAGYVREQRTTEEGLVLGVEFEPFLSPKFEERTEELVAYVLLHQRQIRHCA